MSAPDRVAGGRGPWGLLATANTAVLAEGRRVLIDDPHRFDGVHVMGVNEHVWRHTGRGDKYVIVIIDLTGIRVGTGPVRLVDMTEGCSKQAFKQWLGSVRSRDGSASRSSRNLSTFLGHVTQSHSRPHVSNDNPFSEAQFKTLKCRPDFPNTFGSLEDARVLQRLLPLVQP